MPDLNNTNQKPSVGVVMAVYNPNPKHLKDQLQSILKQTSPVDELIIVDDASATYPDALRALEQPRLETSPTPHIKILRNARNTRHTQAFVRGLLECRSDLIFFSDQDDIWHPDKIAKCTDFLNRNPDILCATHDFLVCDENLFPLDRLTAMERYEKRGIKPFMVGHGFATVIRSEIKELVALATTGRGGHDGWIRTIGNTLGVRAIIHEPLAIWRRHAESHTEILNKQKNAATRRPKRLHFKSRLRALMLEKADINSIEIWLEHQSLLPDSLSARIQAKLNRLQDAACAREAIFSRTTRPMNLSDLRHIRFPTLVADFISILLFIFRKSAVDT